MNSNVGIAFAEALSIIGEVAFHHRLASESIALSRTHGRVLAQPLAASSGTTNGGAVLQAGQVLTPARVSLAASLGLASLQVARRPTVAVFTGGDELVEPGMSLAPGQVYDSNRELLMGLLRADGLEPTAWPRLPGNPRQIEIALRDAGCAFDLVIACGSVSAGAHDQVAAVLASFGQQHFRDVQVQPDSHLLFGSLDQARLLALAGDPVSVLASYLTLGRALVDGLQGRVEARPRWHARLGGAVEKAHPWREYRRARIFSDLDGQLLAELEPALAASNALIVVPEGPRHLASGEAVEVVGYV